LAAALGAHSFLLHELCLASGQFGVFLHIDHWHTTICGLLIAAGSSGQGLLESLDGIVGFQGCGKNGETVCDVRRQAEKLGLLQTSAEVDV
jgi:hypothetical protein